MLPHIGLRTGSSLAMFCAALRPYTAASWRRSGTKLEPRPPLASWSSTSVVEREDKPPWRSVPGPVRKETERPLAARVVRAVRAYGGYGPSATFVLTLDDGRRAFFKGTYPLPEGSGVRWILEEEERVYDELIDAIRPWAPAYFGSFRAEGWHVMLMEAVPGERMPPWSGSRARRAAASFARFHAANLDASLPEWLPRDTHLQFCGHWRALSATDGELERVAKVAGDASEDALAWLRASSLALIERERVLERDLSRTALLHFDTRSDNIRLDGELLRIFDWPFACVGPPEFDLFAFAQSIESEGGPRGEEVVGWYANVLPVEHDLLAASAAALAGYFADRAPRPALAGLPRLRSVQRRQLKASLGFAARLIGLPAPEWLASVPD